MREEIRTIESIMRQQTELYERFAAIEEKKSEELMARSGLLIERYAREQERLVSEIELLFEEMRYGRIRVSETVFPGVKIVIGTLVKPIRETLKFSSFFSEDGEIKVGSFK